MALVKSLNSGVSGLNAFQTKMDVIGNNIANVETAGFKSSSVSFAEMMSERLARAGSASDSAPQLSNQVGLGVRVSSINRDFSQGAMQSTGKVTDLAIEGEGFFLVSDGGEQLMTRAGNFVFNKDGNLVDQGGRSVQGYIADSAGNILGGGAAEDIRIDFENALPPKQTQTIKLAGNLNASTSTSSIIQAQSGFTTGESTAALGTDINDMNQTLSPLTTGDVITFDLVLNDGTTQTITHNYTAGDTVGDMINSFNTALDPAEGEMALIDGMLTLRSAQLGESDMAISSVSVTGSGDINFPNFTTTQEGQTGSQSMSTTVYDDLGRAHSLMLEFTQTAANEWSYEASFMDGEAITSGQTGTLNFDSTGKLSSSNLLNLAFEPGNGGSTTSFTVSLGDSGTGTLFTQYSGSNTAKVISQDGYAQGQLIDIAIDGAGQVQGIYDNGSSMVLAQLALGKVQNNNGLEMVGSGLYRATSAAGEMFVNTAESFTGTSINSGSLEGSNVDLAKEFTEMITSQRAYQSNARVITTSDEMLTEAVNLKR
tara:strand:+ start:203190 stop:204809 length:1620 start_codon:yes stop_codon:yes gene_type:complete